MDLARRFNIWTAHQTAVELERVRLAELRKPPPPTAAYLLKPTRVKVLRGFCVNGRPAQPGEVVTIEWVAARDMIALKKAELVEPGDGER